MLGEFFCVFVVVVDADRLAVNCAIDCKDYVTGIGNGSRALIAICTSPLRHSPLLPCAPVFCVSAQARKKSTTKLPYTTLK